MLHGNNSCKYFFRCYGTVSGYLDVSHPFLWYLGKYSVFIFIKLVYLCVSNRLTICLLLQIVNITVVHLPHNAHNFNDIQLYLYKMLK